MNIKNEIQRRQMWKEIDLFLESFYPNGQNAGRRIAGADLTMAQVRGFENLVFSTLRFSEIINFIKNQAGKQNRTAEKWREVAPLLLKQIDDLESKAKNIGGQDPALVLDAKLRLARGWVKQVVANFLFQKVRPELEVNQ